MPDLYLSSIDYWLVIIQIKRTLKSNIIILYYTNFSIVCYNILYAIWVLWCSYKLHWPRRYNYILELIYKFPVILLLLLYLPNLIYHNMDIDKRKNDFLTSHNTCSEIADIQSKFYSWYAVFVAESLPTWFVTCSFIFILFYAFEGLKIKGSLTSCEHTSKNRWSLL